MSNKILALLIATPMIVMLVYAEQILRAIGVGYPLIAVTYMWSVSRLQKKEIMKNG